MPQNMQSADRGPPSPVTGDSARRKSTVNVPKGKPPTIKGQSTQEKLCLPPPPSQTSPAPWCAAIAQTYKPPAVPMVTGPWRCQGYNTTTTPPDFSGLSQTQEWPRAPAYLFHPASSQEATLLKDGPGDFGVTDVHLAAVGLQIHWR